MGLLAEPAFCSSSSSSSASSVASPSSSSLRALSSAAALIGSGCAATRTATRAATDPHGCLGLLFFRLFRPALVLSAGFVRPLTRRFLFDDPSPEAPAAALPACRANDAALLLFAADERASPVPDWDRAARSDSPSDSASPGEERGWLSRLRRRNPWAGAARHFRAQGSRPWALVERAIRRPARWRDCPRQAGFHRQGAHRPGRVARQRQGATVAGAGRAAGCVPRAIRYRVACRATARHPRPQRIRKGRQVPGTGTRPPPAAVPCSREAYRQGKAYAAVGLLAQDDDKRVDGDDDKRRDNRERHVGTAAKGQSEVPARPARLPISARHGTTRAAGKR